MTRTSFGSHSFIRTLASAAVVSQLSACASLGIDAPGTAPRLASTAPPQMTMPAATAIAGDLVPRLTDQLGRANATVVLTLDHSVFGSALEASLRNAGFAVATDDDAGNRGARDQGTGDQNVIRLAYVLTPIDGQLLARLTTGSLEIGRVYAATDTGAAPTSPVSVMQREGATG